MEQQININDVFYYFLESSKFGRVLELVINSEKTSATPAFEENTERVLCSQFSVTHGHYWS